MADTKISGLTALTGANTASGDLLTIVDVSDTTMAATGTNKKITLTELQGAPVSAGTANGVAYLNGSKVLTTGSALTFDGTTLSNSSSGNASYFSSGGSSGNYAVYGIHGRGQYAILGYYNGTTDFGVYTNSNAYIAGNLGIGTSSPSTVYSRTVHVSAAGAAGYVMTDSTTPRTYAIGANAGVLQFYDVTAGSERARIDSSGNLLVGATSQRYTERFRVIGATVGAVIESASGYVTQYLRNDGASGTRKFVSLLNSSSTECGSITYDGSTVAYNTTSDYRLKDNQQPLTGSGAFIDALQPKTWNWKADGSKGVGFIAHEVQAVSPGSVVGEKDAVDEEGKPIMQAMEYGSAEFIANIIAEIQSLRKRLADAGIA